ncbi:MAG: hypothetical protein IJC73_06550 [Lentisphaeria bacterium]|nr:hypothetical protein [Lentisphaeria bacterium]
MERLDSIIQKIRPTYPRPSTCNDPGGDFPAEELAGLLRKPDCDLTETDLVCLFQGGLPAGEYHEVMYFLPVALKHIAESRESDTADHLLRWMAHNRESLLADGYYDDLLDFFEKLFAELTSGCILQGDYVKNSSLGDALVGVLNEEYDGMGDRLMEKYLGRVETRPQAGWLLCLLADHYAGLHRKSAWLASVARNHELRQKMYDVIAAEAVEDEDSLLFWSNQLDRCGIC